MLIYTTWKTYIRDTRDLYFSAKKYCGGLSPSNDVCHRGGTNFLILITAIKIYSMHIQKNTNVLHQKKKKKLWAVLNWVYIEISNQHWQYLIIFLKKCRSKRMIKVNLLMPIPVLIMQVWSLNGWLNITYTKSITTEWNVGIDWQLCTWKLWLNGQKKCIHLTVFSTNLVSHSEKIII